MGKILPVLLAMVFVLPACKKKELGMSHLNVSPYTQWKNGPRTNPDYFPIGVWLQDPKNAALYKDMGINLYVGLWNGPTEAQLAELRKIGMRTICHQNEVGLKYTNDSLIVAWMHGDEPDNAQSVKTFWKDSVAIEQGWPHDPGTQKCWGNYGPPVPPTWIQRDYKKILTTDPTRPVYLNLGQGVAFHLNPGRGYRKGKIEDYPEYIKGCDIVSFDLYAYSFPDPQVNGKITLVADGVDNLRKWSDNKKVVWNFVECTQVYKGGMYTKPSPKITHAEVWLSLIHGSQGILYYAHGIHPEDQSENWELALLKDPEMSAAVRRINQQVQLLAPVLNRPTIPGGVAVTSSSQTAPIHSMVKQQGNDLYVFAVAMGDSAVTGTFTIKDPPAAATAKDPPAAATAEVLAEGRNVVVTNGGFTDAFPGYGVHIYKIAVNK